MSKLFWIAVFGTALLVWHSNNGNLPVEGESVRTQATAAAAVIAP
ncbi:hypothetical protein [Synechococcus sp. PCC 7336]|nr:hypothetical protein [Synechococcus sp. PCC 7336]